MTDVVLFDEINCDNGKKIALVTLNSPKSLNALSGDMIALLYPQLTLWQQQENIAAVLLQGAGEKAFCAGGDIVHLYQAMKNNDESSTVIEDYFTKEYQLDYLIHRFSKPIIVWGHGIVMGGGLGLLAGASHRIVTEKSRIAMPEISIGLFPDVGASYFLNNMPSHTGLFLALTAASINAADAKLCQLADYFLENALKNDAVEQLKKLPWHDDAKINHEQLSALLATLEQTCIANIPSSQLINHQAFIDTLGAFNHIEDVVSAISAVDIEDKWFNRAQSSLNSGSALSAAITYRQLALAKNLSLADCFRLELGLAVKSGQFGEFLEGVRALLIDKDNKPQWHFSSVADVEKTRLDWFFSDNWPKEQHPLVSLGA